MIGILDEEDELDRTLREVRKNEKHALLRARRTLLHERGSMSPLTLSSDDLERFALAPWAGRVFGMECG